MKVCLKYKKNSIKKYKLEVLIKFIELLQKKLPLKGKLFISLLDERRGRMTTGSYKDEEKLIKILVKNRMLSDIMRTLSHEWAHCYDKQHLNIKDRRDVGGDSENFANAKSGELTKLFIKNNRDSEDIIFESITL